MCIFKKRLTSGVWFALVVLVRLVGEKKVLLLVVHACVPLLAFHSHSVHFSGAFPLVNLTNVFVVLASLDDAVCRAVCPRFRVAFEAFER